MRALVITVLTAILAAPALAQPPAPESEPPPPPEQPPPESPQVPPPEPQPPPSSDELAQAADATAEVAAIGAPAAGEPTATDDIDLSALGLDPAMQAVDDKLSIYGFADLNYLYLHFDRAVPTVKQTRRSFSTGNLNVYFAKNLLARARVLAEIRFTFLPNGMQNRDGTYVDTTAPDFTNFSRGTRWGGIVVERVYAEYDLTPNLTVRAGRWLTPYGIWNIDHGSPAILGTFRPYIIGEQFFPEHQTGVDVFGSYYVSDIKLGARFTTSNGRGGTDEVTDQDDKLAFGGRVEAETPWGLRAGASYYRGRYTALPTAAGVMPVTFREAAYGGDVQFTRGPLHMQGEIIARERHYSAGQREPTAAGFMPDGRDFGFYALAAYRFDRFWNAAPYAYVELHQPASFPYYSGIQAVNLGLNFRPTPSLVLKLQATRSAFADGPEFLGGQRAYYGATQVSWVF